MDNDDLIAEAREATRLDSAIRAGLRHYRRHHRAARQHTENHMTNPGDCAHCGKPIISGQHSWTQPPDSTSAYHGYCWLAHTNPQPNPTEGTLWSTHQ